MFKVNHPEAKSGNGLTQFGRVLKELDIEVIYAHSAEAKGRVERANRTFQDRLIKELRIRNISTMEEANKFLGYYIEKHNQRFALKRPDIVDVHRPLTQTEKQSMERMLSIQTVRTVSKEMIIRHNNVLYKIIAPEQENRLVRAKVTVCETLSGEIKLYHKDQSLQYEVYKELTHSDQVLNRKELNRYLDQLKQIEQCWLIRQAQEDKIVY